MTKGLELVVVGAGPAGLAATQEATALGLSVTLIDASPEPGGQYYKQTPSELGVTPDPDSRARQLLATAAQDNVRLFTDTLVWGIFAEHGDYLLCLYGPPGTQRRMTAKKVILAPGAHDRPSPFPGWTLPGVMTAGAALWLVKHQRILPGRRVVLSGTGPLQWVLASHLIEAGAEVTRILEVNGFPWGVWRYAGALWGQWQRLGEGWKAWRTIRRAGKGIQWGQTVLRAEGNGHVQRAVIGPIDGSGSEIVDADAISLGYGFTPAIQLSRLAGCGHYYDPERGAYAPMRDEWLQTTLSGLFVAGDGGGIAGKDVARLEGHLAATGAALQLGRAADPDRVSTLRLELARQRRFTAVLDALFPSTSIGGKLLTDDTILCRCEEITVGQLRCAINEGAGTVTALRMLTRAGMGRCQGRMCGIPAAELLARQLDRSVEAVGQATPRPPIMPVPLAGLLDDEP